MTIIRYKKLFFTISAVLALVSLLSLGVWGLRLSTDFTGGSLVAAVYDGARPSSVELESSLSSAGFQNFTVRQIGDNGMEIRASNFSDSDRANLGSALSVNGQYKASISKATDVGPTIGAELRHKSIVAVTMVLLCIMFFIAFAFRKVSRPVSSWVYGGIAIVALVSNVVVTLGFFAALGHFTGATVDTLFVTALLTVLGFSVHDTIVVFDRTRENLALNHTGGRKEPFAEVVGKSISQTLVRSINTSVSVVISLGALYYLGPVATQNFALTLLVGIIVGTYSSIALASPLLVVVEEYRSAK